MPWPNLQRTKQLAFFITSWSPQKPAGETARAIDRGRGTHEEKVLTHVDLFSGIGGFSLAAGWAGFRTVCFVEIEPYCQEVLKKHWPGVPIYDDIKKFHWPMADANIRRIERTPISKRRREKRQGEIELIGDGQVTLVTGGFPCQPFSVSGNRRGAEDNRFLWPEMVRIISEIRPSWVIAENVTGFIHMELDRAISDLEGAGYETEPYHIPACAVAAPHERLRVFLVGHTKRLGLSRLDGGRTGTKSENGCQDVADAKRQGQRFRNHADEKIFGDGSQDGKKRGPIYCSRKQENWSVEPAVGRVAYGVPDRMDRLKALGNAVVPQVAYQIIKAIAEIEMVNA